MEYPLMTITKVNHPKPLAKTILSWVVYIAQGLVVLFIYSGEQLIPKIFKLPAPAILAKLKQKQFVVIMAVIMVGGWISNWLTATGAFEVSIEDKLIFSKLTTGHLPGNAELKTLIDRFIQ
eukprot:TRINITY_DN15323_c0_g1_i1.p1 TRINITY_DN15323_c0_g1~~TRINITY_DN15323_c0_g1_i1.p1  ORF type:complete len:121 (+),score=29.68 TRINITY_DN15323_c0_g1_i1:185-547(+)